MDLDGMEPDAAEAVRSRSGKRRSAPGHPARARERPVGARRRPLFRGEVEPCINGKATAIGAYFGENVQHIVDRLLGEQMSDGGWNCEQENGATVGSFHSTIEVLDGLLEY